MERTFFGSSLLRTTARAFLLASLAGSLACSGCKDETSSNNNPRNIDPNNETDMGGTNNNDPDGGTNNVDPNNELEDGSITVAPQMLSVTENGAPGTFTVVLDTEPGSDVTVDLTSGDESEATVAPASLTFNSANWSAPQTVTVSPVDDADLDGTQTITIQTDVTGLDNYATADAADVTVDVLDDDMVGGSVQPTALVVTEGGADASFTVQLSVAPSGDVTIPISVSDNTEITTDVTELVFNAGNFDTPQTVTVSAIVDGEVEPPQTTVSVLTGAAVGGGYDGLDLADVTVTVIDTDDATISVAPTTIATSEDGSTATFDVILSADPSDTVTITPFVTDASEGTVSGPVDLSAGNLTATFTVTGVPDGIDDGPQTYPIDITAVSNDANYNGFNIQSVLVTNANIDAGASVTVTPQMLTVNEAGATSATFTINLDTNPNGDVDINLTSSDVGEATVSPATLSFDSTNFGTAQTVTVTAVDDLEFDGNTVVTIDTVAVAPGTTYDAVAVDNVIVQVIDDDNPGIFVNPTSGLLTSESGPGTDTFTVVLNSQPTADVTIALTSSNPGEGTVSPATLTFTPGNFQTAQTVTLTGVDDLVADGAVLYNATGTATSTDANYDGRNFQVFATNQDDDVPGFTIVPDPSGTPQRTSEDGTTATFTVQLDTPPIADVTIPVLSTDTTEGTVSPMSLTFDSTNWNTPQTVTVTGQDDALQDGPVQFIIVLDQTTSTDPAYNALDPNNVTIINDDNEAGFTVTPLTVSVSEQAPGNTATFQMRLNSPPAQNVRLDLAPDGLEGDEYDVSPQQFVFTPQNWVTLQTATVTGIPDAAIDGNQTWDIDVFVGNTVDADYSADCGGACPAQTVSGTTTDADSIGVTVTPGAFDLSEGDCQTVDVTLATAAVDDLDFDVSLADTSDVTANQLRFTSNNNASVTLGLTISQGTTTASFVVCGFDEVNGIAENTIIEIVDVGAFVSDDPANDPYHGFDPANVTVTVLDNDAPDVIFDLPDIGAFPGNPNLWVIEGFEANGWDTPSGIDFNQLSVRLATQPMSSVIVTLTTTDDTESLVQDVAGNNTGTTISLVFQPGDWSVPQIVRAVDVDDNIIDGNQRWEFTVTVQSAGDAFYDGLSVPPVPGITSDNDAAGWTVVPLLEPFETDESQTLFTIWVVAPNTVPNDDIDLTVNVDDDTEFTLACFGAEGAFCNPSLSFTDSIDVFYPGGNALPDLPIVLFIGIGVEDQIIDGTQPWQVSGTNPVTMDPNYVNTTFPVVSGTNLDNDTSGIIISDLPPDNNPANGIPEIDEDGSNDVEIRLASQPANDVTITVTTSDTGELVTSSTATLTFTSVTWNNPQSVDIDGVEDNTIDGDQVVDVIATAASTDPNYNGLTASEPIEVLDIDTGALEVDFIPAPPITTNESGTTHTMRVRLTSQPTADVTVPVYSFNTAEATVSVSQLVFTSANWATFQNVIITGVDDAVADGDQNFDIVLDVSTSADLAYNGLPAQTFVGTNIDDDTIGVTIIQPTGPDFLVTHEDGTSDTFQVVLNTAPAPGTEVRIVFGESGGACPGSSQCVLNWPGGVAASANGTISPGAVVFTSANWNVPQTVTVTGGNNVNTSEMLWYRVTAAVDAAHPMRDTAYDGVVIAEVLGVLIDNDNETLLLLSKPYGEVGGGPGIEQVVITGEGNRTGTAYLIATESPNSNVTVGLSTSGEASVQATATITSTNRNSPNALVFTGLDDGNSPDASGFAPFTINVTGTSSDVDYDLVDRDFDGINVDNDLCQFVLYPETSGGNRIVGDTNTFIPFQALVTVDPAGVPVNAFLDFENGVVEDDRNISINPGAVGTTIHAYATGGDFDITISYLLGDNCYAPVPDVTLFGTE